MSLQRSTPTNSDANETASVDLRSQVLHLVVGNNTHAVLLADMPSLATHHRSCMVILATLAPDPESVEYVPGQCGSSRQLKQHLTCAIRG